MTSSCLLPLTLLMHASTRVDAMPNPSAITSALPLFNPSRSSSANVDQSSSLTVHYADANTELTGLLCRDDVQLGEYRARLSFACWTSAPNQQFWAEMGNGVLGLGPRYQKQHDVNGKPLPSPALLGFTARDAVDSNAAGLPPKFAFMATKTAAELQLGGFVKGSTVGQMRTTPSISTKTYSLSINSIRIGDDFDSALELLVFSPSSKGRHVPALLDTGSPCIMLPSNAENGDVIKSPYSLYQNYNKKWSKMFITVNGIDQGLEIRREDLEVEHHTFLDEAWGTNIRPCVMPVTWAMKPPHKTPIVLGAVFFRAFNVMFDLTGSSATVPPTIGIAKLNPRYQPVGISDYAVIAQGGQGENVHRIFVQHIPTKIVSKGEQEVGVANPNGHQFFAQIFVGTPAQPLRVVVDTGSPLFGVFVSPTTIGKYNGGPTGLAHRRPPHLVGSRIAANANSVMKTRASARKNMTAIIKIVPFIGVVVLVLLLLFLRYRRKIMVSIYFATKPDLPYR